MSEEQHCITAFINLVEEKCSKCTVFVQTANYICPICKLYLSELQNVFLQRTSIVSPLLSNYLVGEKRGETCKSFKTLETDEQTAAV